MALQKKDFIEIDFTGKIKDGGVFDSTKKKELESSGIQGNPKPFVFSLGQKMFLEAIDEYLIGKEVGKKYTIELTPEKAFGKRDPKQLQMIPLKVFYQHQINPVPGASFNFDGKIAKILTVSGGRVMVDFNNPLAGKDIIYDIEVKRKVDDLNEQVKALNDFFFRREVEFEIEDKNLKMKVDDQIGQFAEMFKEQYKEILGLDLQIIKPLPKADKKEGAGKVEKKDSEEKGETKN